MTEDVQPGGIPGAPEPQAYASHPAEFHEAIRVLDEQTERLTLDEIASWGPADPADRPNRD